MAGHTESARVIPKEIAERALVPGYNWSSFALSTLRIIVIVIIIVIAIVVVVGEGRRAGRPME